MKRYLSVLGLTLIAMVGCGERGAGEVAWTGTRDTVGGVEVVRNPDRAPDSEPRASAVELWRVTDTGRRGRWEEPRALAFTTGRVAVLDPQAHRVYVVARSTGKDLGAFGREGGGPGELQRPFGLAYIGDTLVVGNGGGPRADLFVLADSLPEATPYRYERSIRLDFLPFALDGLDNGRLWMTGLSGRDGVNQLLTLDGEAEQYEAPDTSIVAPELVFADCPRWTAGRGVILRGCGTQFAFQELTYSGELIREVHVERPPVMATAAELDSLETTMRKRLGEVGMTDQQKEAFIDRMLERAPKAVYAAYRADAASGYIYVLDQKPADLGEDVATVHVLDSAGRYFARLSFDRRWRTFEVADDRIYALEVDAATGHTALVAYEIDIARPYRNR